MLDLPREWLEVKLASLLRPPLMLNKLERLLDLGRELGDSPGEVTGEERMGDRGRPFPGMMLSSRGLLAPEPGGPDTAVGVAEAARPAVEDTVDTMEGGGDGVMDREAGGTVPDLMRRPDTGQRG